MIWWLLLGFLVWLGGVLVVWSLLYASAEVRLEETRMT